MEEITERKTFDVGIIGGGVVGLSIAFELVRRGKRVFIIDKNLVGREGSWAGGGLLRPGQIHPESDDFLRLSLESYSLYQSFVDDIQEQSGYDVEYLKSGAIHIATSSEELAHVTEKMTLLSRKGFSIQKLSTEHVKKHVPIISDSVLGGFFNPHDFQVNNRIVLDGLSSIVRRHGGTIIENQEVTEIHESEDGVFGLSTHFSSISCRNVVCCSGAWTSKLIQGISVTPLLGQMIRFDVSSIPEFGYIINSTQHFLIPRLDRTLIVGAVEIESNFRKGITSEAFANLHSNACNVLPSLIDCPVVEEWSGLEPATLDTFPIIGELREGLYIATGHVRTGFLLAPITAKMIADEICDGVRYEEYSPKRFLFNES